MNNTETQIEATGGNRAFKATFEVSDPVQSLAELAHIMLNLRQHTRQYDIKLGSDARNRKRFWEEKADTWISKHIVNDKTENG